MVPLPFRTGQMGKQNLLSQSTIASIAPTTYNSQRRKEKTTGDNQQRREKKNIQVINQLQHWHDQQEKDILKSPSMDQELLTPAWPSRRCSAPSPTPFVLPILHRCKYTEERPTHARHPFSASLMLTLHRFPSLLVVKGYLSTFCCQTDVLFFQPLAALPVTSIRF